MSVNWAVLLFFYDVEVEKISLLYWSVAEEALVVRLEISDLISVYFLLICVFKYLILSWALSTSVNIFRVSI